MKASSLDLLEKSQLPPGQARAILQVMETELANHNDMLATRADLFAMRAEMATKADLFVVKADLAAVKADLELKLEGLRGDMHATRAELIGEIKGGIRWNFAFWTANLATTIALLKLLR